MKCPYNLKRILQVNQNIYEYDENGFNTVHSHKLIENKFLMECLKEDCAVWQDSHCNYKGG